MWIIGAAVNERKAFESPAYTAGVPISGTGYITSKLNFEVM
jgi:hypothetical protein